MRVTVTIPTINRSASLQRLLDSLARQTHQPDEVIVVDASDPFYPAMSPGKWKFVHLRADEPNLPRQRWQGISIASGDIVVFLDDDVVPQSRYIELLLQVYERDGNAIVGGVGGWLANDPPLGNSHRRSRRLLFSGLPSEESAVVHRGGLVKMWSAPPFFQEVEVPCFAGGAMSFRTSVLREIGFQEWLYDLYRRRIGRGEDVILCSLVRNAGHRLVLLPRNIAIHYAGEGGSAYSRQGYSRGLADTWSRYLGSRLLAGTWSFLDYVSFCRYAVILVAVRFMRKIDFKYFFGAIVGLGRCLFSPLPFEVRKQRDHALSIDNS